MAFTDDFRSWMRRTGAPGTVGVILALLAVSLYCWLFRSSGPGLLEALSFNSAWYTQPWSLLTYSFAYAGLGVTFIFFVLECLWIFWTGGSVERDQGTARFLGIWFFSAGLAALMMWAVATALHLPIVLHGPELAVAAVTVLWGVRNPTLTVLLMFIIPVRAIWIAWATIGFTLFGFGQAHPALGIAACVHLAIAYAFALNRIPGLPYARAVAPSRPSKMQAMRDQKFFDDVRKREQDRQERERLRRLFEGGPSDEDRS